MIKTFYNNFDLLKYIGSNYYKCLYLYMDYKKYGINDNKIKVFYQMVGNEVKLVMLNYSTSLHIYSKDLECDYKELINFINKNKYKAIFGQKEIIEKIAIILKQYKSEYGYIRRFNPKIATNDDSVISANESNFEEIIKLIMMDEDISSIYTEQDLLNQLKERYSQKFSRNYVIKHDKKIVGHICTNGEIDKFAIIALLVVHPNYRRKGIASRLIKKIAYDLNKEGKEAYLVNYSNESSNLYEKLGFEIILEYGKLFL